MVRGGAAIRPWRWAFSKRDAMRRVRSHPVYSVFCVLAKEDEPTEMNDTQDGTLTAALICLGVTLPSDNAVGIMHTAHCWDTRYPLPPSKNVSTYNWELPVNVVVPAILTAERRV